MTGNQTIEIIMKNASQIIAAAEAGTDQLTICGESEKINLRNIRTWGFIFNTALKRFPPGTGTGDVLRYFYLENKGLTFATEKIRMSRQSVYYHKPLIRHFVIAAACQLNIWHVINPDRARVYEVERSVQKDYLNPRK